MAALALAAGVSSVAVLAQTPAQTQTRPAWENVLTAMTPEDLKTMPMDTGPSGRDLPPGSGTAKQGAQIFAQKCAMCHGVNGEGYAGAPGSGEVQTGPIAIGGKGIQLWGSTDFNPGVSRAMYAAYPTTIWNATMVSMPAYNPGSLTPDEGYSLVAYILARNEIIKEDMVLNREMLPKVQMPRRNDYLPAKFEDILDLKKRGCYKTFAICEPIAVPEGSFKPPPGGKW